MNSPPLICCCDYNNPAHAQAVVGLLGAYAQDPMGGGQGLSGFALANVVQELAKRPQAYSILAFVDGVHGGTNGKRDLRAVGLVNCFEGFSTFACRPLVNVHDVVVLPEFRGQGIAGKMLELAETLARERGACKLTLEVLQGNHGAARVYERIGFAAYQLDPAMGQARFLQKWLE